MRFEDLDKKIKEAADQHHPAYDEHAWQRMLRLLNEHLPQPTKGRRRIIFFLFLFMFLGGGAFLVISRPWNKDMKTAYQPSVNQRDQLQPTNNQPGKPATTPSVTEKELSNKTEIESGSPDILQQELTSIAPEKQEQLSVRSKNKTGERNLLKNGILPYTNNVISSNQEEMKKDNNVEVTATADDKKNVTPGKTQVEINPVVRNENIDKKDDNKLNKDDLAEKKEEPEQIANTETARVDKIKPQKNSGSKNRNGFAISVSAGPDVSKAASSKAGRTTLVYGAGLSYTRNRLSLRTGVYASKKIYAAGPKDYTLSYIPSPNLKFDHADADCNVIEIPLNLYYNFGLGTRNNWFAGAGLSSYLMKKEVYEYLFKTNTSQYYHHYEVKNENQNYFSILNLSAGYTRQINKMISISAEPYVRIPLDGIGVGKVHLYSGGVLFTAAVKPFNNKSKKK